MARVRQRENSDIIVIDDDDDDEVISITDSEDEGEESTIHTRYNHTTGEIYTVEILTKNSRQDSSRENTPEPPLLPVKSENKNTPEPQLLPVKSENKNTPEPSLLPVKSENKNTPEPPLFPVKSENKVPITYPCRSCNRQFINNDELLHHSKGHEQNIEAKSDHHYCSICKKSFTLDLIYKRHLREHNLNSLPGGSSSNGLLHRDSSQKNVVSLESHDRQALPIKKMKIEESSTCDLEDIKVFSPKSTILKPSTSELIHPETPRFSCNVCNAKFRYSFALKQHKLHRHGKTTLEPEASSDVRISKILPIKRENPAELKNASYDTDDDVILIEDDENDSKLQHRHFKRSLKENISSPESTFSTKRPEIKPECNNSSDTDDDVILIYNKQDSQELDGKGYKLPEISNTKDAVSTEEYYDEEMPILDKYDSSDILHENEAHSSKKYESKICDNTKGSRASSFDTGESGSCSFDTKKSGSECPFDTKESGSEWSFDTKESGSECSYDTKESGSEWSLDTKESNEVSSVSDSIVVSDSDYDSEENQEAIPFDDISGQSKFVKKHPETESNTKNADTTSKISPKEKGITPEKHELLERRRLLEQEIEQDNERMANLSKADGPKWLRTAKLERRGPMIIEPHRMIRGGNKPRGRKPLLKQDDQREEKLTKGLKGQISKKKKETIAKKLSVPISRSPVENNDLLPSVQTKPTETDTTIRSPVQAVSPSCYNATATVSTQSGMFNSHLNLDCPACNKSFKYEFSRKLHLKVRHPGFSTSADTSQQTTVMEIAQTNSGLLCKYCNREFEHQYTLENHIERNHPNFVNKQESSPESNEVPSTTDVANSAQTDVAEVPKMDVGDCETLLSCKYCDSMEFKDECSLEKHVQINHPKPTEKSEIVTSEPNAPDSALEDKQSTKDGSESIEFETVESVANEVKQILADFSISEAAEFSFIAPTEVENKSPIPETAQDKSVEKQVFEQALSINPTNRDSCSYENEISATVKLDKTEFPVDEVQNKQAVLKGILKPYSSFNINEESGNCHENEIAPSSDNNATVVKFDITKNRHQCLHCPQSFRYWAEIHQHMQIQHSQIQMSSDEEKKLEKNFDDKGGAVKSSDTSNVDKSSFKKVNEKKRYDCECGFSSYAEMAWDFHVKDVKTDKRYQCKTCKKDFRCVYYRRKHIDSKSCEKSVVLDELSLKARAALKNFKIPKKITKSIPSLGEEKKDTNSEGPSSL